jgi:hypothetical protein
VAPNYKIEWYQDSGGDAPVHRWLTEELSDEARGLVGAAILEILQADGPDVCGTRFGRQLGEGVFEFRLDGDPQPWIDAARRRRGKVPKGLGLRGGAKVQYRLFCHAHGDKLILLLGAYDKGQDVSKKRQQEEIRTAKARLKMWEQQQRDKARASSKRPFKGPGKKRP